MKLSPLEQKLLGAISLQGDASLPELAKQLNTKTHKCRYALNSLFEKGALTRRVIINSFRLGYSIHALWFSLNSKYRKDPIPVHRFLKESKEVGYFGEYTGDHRYRIDLYTQTLHELRTFFANISEKLGDVFLEKEVATIYSISDYPLKHLYPENGDLKCARVEYDPAMIAIDELDHQILQALSTIDSASHSTIARTLEIPLTTLEYRIKKLQERSIIVGYHVWPHVEKLEKAGIKSTLHRIRLASYSPTNLSCIEEFALHEPSVFSCTHYIGEWDLEICSSTRSKEEVEGFMNSLENAFGTNIAAITSRQMIQHHKISNYPA